MNLEGGIIYSLVAIKTVVLVEHSTREGNFITLANVILGKVQSEDHRRSYKDKTGNYIFHYMVQDGVTFLCFATKDHKTGICFSYLDDLSKKFTSMFDKDQLRKAQAYDPRYAGFARTLEVEMEKYSQMRFTDSRIETMDQRNSQVKDVMYDNINRTIKRGEDVEDLLLKTQIMVVDSDKYKETAKKVKVKMWWKLVGVWVIGAILLIIIIWLIFSIACGFDFGCLDS
eukprot:TRINITY_DN6327_c0_g1_i1.p1 TRINITY_DN6327_c0_g1~~TRINITY_DN6327_c0_g1_i1.p1  ORF type:complete len:228 (-),score=30.13 TRINITY_DN6327_c0_g1_i1:30-713(-)